MLSDALGTAMRIPRRSFHDDETTAQVAHFAGALGNDMNICFV